MKQITNEMIIQNLNGSSQFILLSAFFEGLFFVVLVSLLVIKLIKNRNTKMVTSTIIVTVIVALFFGIPAIKNFLKYSAIKYSIANNCFEVVSDTVKRKNFKSHDNGYTYYFYLENNGKITVDERTYYDCSEGQSVYVVIAKGRLGGKYPTSQVYLKTKYQYNNS